MTAGPSICRFVSHLRVSRTSCFPIQDVGTVSTCERCAVHVFSFSSLSLEPVFLLVSNLSDRLVIHRSRFPLPKRCRITFRHCYSQILLLSDSVSSRLWQFASQMGLVTEGKQEPEQAKSDGPEKPWFLVLWLARKNRLKIKVNFAIRVKTVSEQKFRCALTTVMTSWIRQGKSMIAVTPVTDRRLKKHKSFTSRHCCGYL